MMKPLGSVGRLPVKQRRYKNGKNRNQRHLRQNGQNASDEHF
jgi:hypothetical protein